jgi:hypothetical protein
MIALILRSVQFSIYEKEVGLSRKIPKGEIKTKELRITIGL